MGTAAVDQQHMATCHFTHQSVLTYHILNFSNNDVVVDECIYEPYVFSHLVAMSSAECNDNHHPKP